MTKSFSADPMMDRHPVPSTNELSTSLAARSCVPPRLAPAVPDCVAPDGGLFFYGLDKNSCDCVRNWLIYMVRGLRFEATLLGPDNKLHLPQVWPMRLLFSRQAQYAGDSRVFDVR